MYSRKVTEHVKGFLPSKSPAPPSGWQFVNHRGFNYYRNFTASKIRLLLIHQ